RPTVPGDSRALHQTIPPDSAAPIDPHEPFPLTTRRQPDTDPHEPFPLTTRRQPDTDPHEPFPLTTRPQPDTGAVPGGDRPTIPAAAPEIVPRLTAAGDGIQMGPLDLGVAGATDDSVLLQRLNQRVTVEEPRVVSADDLTRDYRQIGDTDYYVRS